MRNHPDAIRFVQGLIRAEKHRRGLSWQEVSAALARRGIRQSATNLSTKVARGTLSAPVFVAVLRVIGVERIDLDQLELQAPRRR
jgi:hypothetical protein